MKVRPGPDGLQAFLRQLEAIVGRDVANVNFVFRCRCPDTGAEIFLQGLHAFEAAMHCACVRAAQRSLQQQQQAAQRERQQQQQQQRERQQEEREVRRWRQQQLLLQEQLPPRQLEPPFPQRQRRAFSLSPPQPQTGLSASPQQPRPLIPGPAAPRPSQRLLDQRLTLPESPPPQLPPRGLSAPIERLISSSCLAIGGDGAAAHAAGGGSNRPHVSAPPPAASAPPHPFGPLTFHSQGSHAASRTPNQPPVQRSHQGVQHVSVRGAGSARVLGHTYLLDESPPGGAAAGSATRLLQPCMPPTAAAGSGPYIAAAASGQVQISDAGSTAVAPLAVHDVDAAGVESGSLSGSMLSDATALQDPGAGGSGACIGSLPCTPAGNRQLATVPAVQSALVPAAAVAAQASVGPAAHAVVAAPPDRVRDAGEETRGVGGCMRRASGGGGGKAAGGGAAKLVTAVRALLSKRFGRRAVLA